MAVTHLRKVVIAIVAGIVNQNTKTEHGRAKNYNKQGDGGLRLNSDEIILKSHLMR